MNINYSIIKFILLPKKKRYEIYNLLYICFGTDSSYIKMLPFTYIIQIVYKNKIIGICSFIHVDKLIELFKKIYSNLQYPLPIITFNGVFMNNLCIHPYFRKIGLSKIIVRLLINLCKEKDYDHILCQVNTNNTKALKLYQNYKFRIHSTGLLNNQKWNIMYYVIP
jgi:ribosomal protein S18 acetylase RimI-like enzyme